MKERGFEVAKGWENRGINLPRRATKKSAGYDIEAAEDTVVPKFRFGIKPTKVATGLKVYCQDDEFLLIANRSSGAGKGLVMANGLGVIDADYYGNADNDGHFVILVLNLSDENIMIKKGDRVAQAIFQKYLTADNDTTMNERVGGIGSTDNCE